jgi:hypothetical protein
MTMFKSRSSVGILGLVALGSLLALVACVGQESEPDTAQTQSGLAKAVAVHAPARTASCLTQDNRVCKAECPAVDSIDPTCLFNQALTDTANEVNGGVCSYYDDKYHVYCGYRCEDGSADYDILDCSTL